MATYWNAAVRGWLLMRGCCVEEMAPVEEETARKLKQLETKLQEKELAVKKLQERVPRMAAANARRELATARKRHANVLVTYVCRGGCWRRRS